MSGSNVFNPTSNFSGKAANVVIRYAAELNAKPLIAPPSTWFKGLAMERSGAELARFYIPVHSIGDGTTDGDDFTGSMKFTGTSSVFFDVQRKVKQQGVMELAQRIAEMDFGAFDKAPDSLAKWAGKLDQRAYARLWNNGYTTSCWAGPKYWAISTSGSAGLKVCPGRPALGKFLNAYENSAITPANILRAMSNIDTRVGFDGQDLELEAAYFYCSRLNRQTAKALLVTQQLLPQVGANNGDTGGNTSQVWGQLLPVIVPGMRDDMWVVGAEPPDEWFRPFARNAGGPVGQYQANTDPDKSGSGVPYQQVIVYGPDDHHYKDHLKMGISLVVNVGFALATPHCYCANFTGSAS
jgi:hypothetical protein